MVNVKNKTEMEKRIQIDRLEPGAYKIMLAFEKYLLQTELTKTHRNLIYLRASQINGCAFCINMHTKEALKNNETQQRIFLLSAWRETDLFTEEEQTLLEITEEVTLIHHRGLSSQTYEKATAHFGENYLAQIIMAIVTINAWNRIAVSTHKPF